MLDALTHSWLAECAGLFFGTFVQEDIAVVAGGMLVIEHGLPLALALVSLYSGVVVSDVLVYGLGVAARRLPWARRLLISDKVERIRTAIERHIVASVGICRFCPGLLFPTFLACGWTGVSFGRFLAVTMGAAVIHTTLLLVLTMALGATAVRQVGYWGWAALFGAALAMAVYGALRPAWGMFIRTVAGRGGTAARPAPNRTLPGMPPIEDWQGRVSLAERIPPLLFYVPIVLRWLALGVRYRSLTLPTVANPLIEAGGLWGESKSELMNQISGEYRRWVAPFVTVERSGPDDAQLEADLRSADAALRAAGLAFPVVAKPDVGWQGYGARMVETAEELQGYLRGYPPGRRVVLQRPVPYDGEAGVFYIRMPDQPKGRIASLTLRYYPYVVGDGVSTIRQLVEADERTRFKARHLLGGKSRHAGLRNEDLSRVPSSGEIVRLSFIGSLRVGGLYRDARSYITPAMSERFEAIAQSIPEFYFGRFDVRFKSIERLQQGEDFEIIEVNGAGSEAVHIWDPAVSLADVYRELFLYQSLLFEVSARNRANGHCPMGLRDFLGFTRAYSRLMRLYPPSA